MSTEMLELLSIIERTDTWPAELIDFIAPETRVIYSDVDGTLLGPGGCLFVDEGNNFTATPAQAVLECHLNQIDVVLVSGRNRHQLRSDARILGFKNWIAELGCQIAYNMGEVVVLNVGDFAITHGSVWETVKASGAPELLLNRYDGLIEYHLPWSHNRECTHLFRGGVDVDDVNNFLLDNGFEALRLVDNGRVRRRSERLNPDIAEVHAYHLLPKESGKASAVRKDLETRGIPKAFSAAVGDSEADLELADEVGILFLVRNAVTENPGLLTKIRAYPNVFVTHEAMGLGWAEAVRFLIHRKHR